MPCKKHKYSKVYLNGNSDISVKDLAKQGNKSIKGLMTKCVAVKKKGCKK